MIGAVCIINIAFTCWVGYTLTKEYTNRIDSLQQQIEQLSGGSNERQSQSQRHGKIHNVV